MREKRDEIIILRTTKAEKNRIYEKMLGMGIRSLSAQIQDIMGHKDISTTMEIYAEATKEAKAHSFANLNGKLGISV